MIAGASDNGSDSKRYRLAHDTRGAFSRKLFDEARLQLVHERAHDRVRDRARDKLAPIRGAGDAIANYLSTQLSD